MWHLLSGKGHCTYLLGSCLVSTQSSLDCSIVPTSIYWEALICQAVWVGWVTWDPDKYGVLIGECCYRGARVLYLERGRKGSRTRQRDHWAAVHPQGLSWPPEIPGPPEAFHVEARGPSLPMLPLSLDPQLLLGEGHGLGQGNRSLHWRKFSGDSLKLRADRWQHCQ